MADNRKRLDELCRSITDCPHSTPKWTSSGNIVIRNNNIKAGRLDLSNPSFTDDVDFNKRIQRATPESGDIIITREAPMGEVCRVPIGLKCCLGQRMVLLKPNYDLVDGDYLLFALMSRDVQAQIMWSEGTGSTVSNLRIPHLCALSIPYLPLEKQKAIGRLLAALDEKININNRINDNLLQQATAIFNAHYNAAKMQRPFTSMISVLGGGTPKTGNSDFWNGEIPFFTPKDVGSPYVLQTEKTITASGLEHCNSRLYPKDTTFVTARGTVGKVSLAGKPMAMNQSCYALTSNTLDPIMVFFYTLRAVESLKHKASGAVFDAIVTRDFETETLNAISVEDTVSIVAIIKPLMTAIHVNEEECLRLIELRNSLLPRLMSGEIDISNVPV